VEIRTGDSHSIIDRASGRRLNPAQSVRIGDHVWLAPHVRVLKGVSIGDGSVIGTGSVVTAPIADHVVACGIPAAVVRENIDWDRRRLQGETAEAASGRGP
jgi:acetyltransferase-like isoleucine patch superfamily enzyme